MRFNLIFFFFCFLVANLVYGWTEICIKVGHNLAAHTATSHWRQEKILSLKLWNAGRSYRIRRCFSNRRRLLIPWLFQTHRNQPEYNISIKWDIRKRSWKSLRWIIWGVVQNSTITSQKKPKLVLLRKKNKQTKHTNKHVRKKSIFDLSLSWNCVLHKYYRYIYILIYTRINTHAIDILCIM